MTRHTLFCIKTWLFLPLISMLSIGVFTGCITGKPDMPPGPVSVQPEPVVLEPLDEIEIKFAYAAEYNENQTIRPDGKIALQFVGEVQAAGKTPDQLRKDLQQSFARHLKYPDLIVIVRTLNDQKVYVGGQVRSPGIVPLSSRMTVLEAIMESGGVDEEFAKSKNVVVLRQTADKRNGYLVNVKQSFKEDPVDVFYLQPRDIVYVPRKTIVKVNEWMEQYSNKMVPKIGLRFNRTRGRTSFGYSTGD